MSTDTRIRDEQIAAVLWREIFYLRGKIRYHVDKAVEWQLKVDQLEAAADVEAPRRSVGRLTRRKGQELDPAYQVGALLRDRTDYKNTVGNRNAHQAQANLFSAALTALMLSNPPQLRDCEVPGMEFFVEVKTREGYQA